jgi:hypothetical protein
LSTWGAKPRAGDNGFISPKDYDAINGFIGFFDLISIVAKRELPLISGGASTGGALTSALNIANIYKDLSSSGKNSLGDKFRLGLNSLFLAADVIAPFSGFAPTIADSYGFFEYGYHQMDVYESTGYWVYYNWYTKNWNKINLR